MGKPKCSVEDCMRERRKLTYCNRHYENLRKYGDPVPRRDRSLEARLREVGWTITGSGCWEWDGSRNEYDYGIFNARRLGIENARAHRVIYEHLAGPLAADQVLRHRCDNPPCVNPEHLEPGTQGDNVRDMTERGRHWMHGRTRCKNGHDLTLPGATRTVVRARGNETICVKCDRARKARYDRSRRPGPR